MEKPTIRVAAVGHPQHGKTTLAAALTTVLAKEYGGTARTAAEIQAGTRPLLGPVRASQVQYQTTVQHVIHEDVAGGDADTAGAFGDSLTDGTPFNGLLLAVDAVQGLEPLSGVYIRSAHEAGLGAMVVALTKADLVEDVERLEVVELEIRELMSSVGFLGDDIPVVRCAPEPALRGDEAARQTILQLADAMADQFKSAG
ncbi:GTP-binding protein [Streptomyces sp. NPDC015232]|uniref:GTP-binding protein n=1 Tax=unclassified Streptomyces TaxID=2593676 RepID=UPI0036FCFEF4